MVSIQERFLIKSGLQWRGYGIHILKKYLNKITYQALVLSSSKSLSQIIHMPSSPIYDLVFKPRKQGRHSTSMHNVTDYGRMMIRFQILNSPKLYIPHPDRKSCKMYENLSFLQKKWLSNAKSRTMDTHVTKFGQIV